MKAISFEVSTDVSHHHVPRTKLGGGMSGSKVHLVIVHLRNSRTLHKYPRGVLVMRVENNEPKNGYNDCRPYTTYV